MESDDEEEELNVAEAFLRHSALRRAAERPTLFGHLQQWMPRQTIVYIQYCLLRIPFLLLYDYIFTEQFSHRVDGFLQYSIDVIDQEKHFFFLPISYILHSYLFQALIEVNLLFSIPILGLILLAGLLLCSDRHLVMFYSYTISFLVIYFYYQMHRLTDMHLNMLLLQIILSFIYIQMINMRLTVQSTALQRTLCHLAPVLFLTTRFVFSLSFGLLIWKCYFLVWTSVHLSEALIYQRQSIIRLLRSEFVNELLTLYENQGLQIVLNYLQENIHIVSLLKIFWFTKILISPLSIRAVYAKPFVSNVTRQWSLILLNGTLAVNGSIENRWDYNETLTSTMYFTGIYYGTETVFTLISLACLVSYGMKAISHRLFRLLHLWTEEVEQIGTVIGVMFFLLLFQSNLTRLDLHRRHVPLLKAFSLLLVALCHFLHTILEPQLLKVAMQTMTTRMAFNQMNEEPSEDDDDEETNLQQNTSLLSKLKTISRVLRSFHHRHVYTCISIFIILIFYIILLWRLTAFSTWLLAITAFSLELIVRLTASLAQYTLYVLDAHNLLSNADSFDEYIFRIKAVTSCFEFILGVFLLFNGSYILFFEASGALRAFMLAIHAYLNIVKNFRRGWQILLNRRSASDNVNQLPLATEEQIENYNDICPICHNALTVGNTCVTPCAHFFHKKCLQKVFYATQNCALCSRPIIIARNDRHSPNSLRHQNQD